MAAAGMLLAQNELLLSGYWMQEKLTASAARFAKRLLCGQHGDGAKEDLRMLTALTNRGMVTFEQTVQTLADKIVCIKDPFGTVAQCYLRAVRQQAQKQGLHMILCASPLQVGKIDHILLPECRIAVVTQDRYQRFAHCENISVIRAGRFLPPKQLKQMKGAFRHRNRMTDQLLLDAAEALKQAKALHDQLEQHYTAAVDFEKVNRLTEQVIDEMKKRV
jgi:hypothetical protein